MLDDLELVSSRGQLFICDVEVEPLSFSCEGYASDHDAPVGTPYSVKRDGRFLTDDKGRLVYFRNDMPIKAGLHAFPGAPDQRVFQLDTPISFTASEGNNG